MATMEIKGLHHSTMMRRREEMDPHIQNVASESCSTMVQEEAEGSKYKNNNKMFIVLPA